MPKGPFFGSKWIGMTDKHVSVLDLIGFGYAFKNENMINMMQQYEDNIPELGNLMAKLGTKMYDKFI